MGIVELKGVRKFFGENEVLKGVDLSVERGETVVVIGPSGGGKSTLLRCINYLERPESGEVRIDGQVVSERNVRSMRQKVGMVFQHFNLFKNKDVLGNCVYGPRRVLGRKRKEVEEEVMELLNSVGLEDKANSDIADLSGGQKQRVAIVRAMAMHPEVLLLDEPTSALDPEMVKGVLEVIQGLTHRGMTVVMNTHEMGFAREVADRVVFMDSGQIIEDNKPEVLFDHAKSERVREFLGKVL